MPLNTGDHSFLLNWFSIDFDIIILFLFSVLSYTDILKSPFLVGFSLLPFNCWCHIMYTISWIGLSGNGEVYADCLLGSMRRSYTSKEVRKIVLGRRSWLSVVGTEASANSTLELGWPFRVTPNWGERVECISLREPVIGWGSSPQLRQFQKRSKS